ncbi:MAG TPA: NAD(P)-dependent oxidoreductase, partial [Myxococcota bacterium]
GTGIVGKGAAGSGVTGTVGPNSRVPQKPGETAVIVPHGPVPDAAYDFSLRLDDVLDHLASGAGAGQIADIKQSLEAAGVNFKSVLGPGLVADVEDAFEGLVASHLEGSFLLPKQSVAALPNAITYAFAHVADKNGHVQGSDVEKLGPKATALFTQIGNALDGGNLPLPTSRPKTKYAWLPNQVIELVAKSAARDDLAARMPVLDDVNKLLGGKDKLKGLKFCAVQHLFPTTGELLRALESNGLDPKQATISGKNYSTNHDVMHRLRADGWNIPTLSIQKLLLTNEDGSTREVSPLGNYLAAMFADVRALQKNDPAAFAKLKGPMFLVLDEGGKLLKLIHELVPELAHLCVAVEQTDRGVQVIEEMKRNGIELLCPVVNVARSEAKKKNEAPMIGESVVHSAFLAIEQLNERLTITPKEAVVIGYGAVGKATADALRRRGYTVFVHDIDPKKMQQAQADGCTPGTREETLQHAHLLFSCTGQTTITPDEFDALLPKHAVLVNAASGNHELGMEGRESGGGLLRDNERADDAGWRIGSYRGLELKLGDIAGNDEMASCVWPGKDGAERLLVRSGYVVNMVDDIPPEYIQLTRSLLLAACLQAVDEHGKVGLVDLDKDAQDLVVSRTARDLRRQGHDLQRPDFRTLAPAEG